MHTKLPLTSHELRENRLEWIQALESGKYKQGINYLCQDIKDVKHFCCLGVLQSLIPDMVWVQRMHVFGVYDEKVLCVSFPTLQTQELVDVFDKISKLTTMNDTGRKTFKDIAQYLRNLWDIRD